MKILLLLLLGSSLASEVAYGQTERKFVPKRFSLNRQLGSIAGGLTGIAGDIVDIKNNISHALHDVSPNILGPIADALDPDWLIGMNYTRWVMDLEEAVTEGNTERWIKTVSRMFDVPRVVEEIKESKITKISCVACKFGVNLSRNMMKTGKSDQDILKLASRVCSLLQIQTSRVCEGVMQLIGIDLVEVVKESDMTPSQICNFLMGDACLNGYDARHDWKVAFPNTQKTARHPTSPPLQNSPNLKVLQISDTHHDQDYKIGGNAQCGEPVCCREDNGPPASDSVVAGKWGDYRKCDAPIWLLENALKHIADTHKDVDYIIWTGDIPPHDVWKQTREGNLEYLRFANSLMAKYFDGIPIFPSVGNHESCPVDSFAPSEAPPKKNMSWLYDELDRLWSRWLPADTSETIRRGAYYSTLVRPGLRILSVNGNYCSKNNFWLLKNSTDPAGELAWMIRELDKAEANGERVHIIGHVPPGGKDCLKVWSKNYYDIINRYEGIIMAQFYGHTHFDEFEVFYDTKDFKRPLSVGYISPSITPWENVNPAYRIYYVEGDHDGTTRSIVDHETWKMNLDEANRNDNPVWYKSYNARNAYNMSSLLPKDWDNLITRLSKDDKLFDTYHRNYYRNSPVRPSCNQECKRNLLCDMRSGRSQDSQNFCRDL